MNEPLDKPEHGWLERWLDGESLEEAERKDEKEFPDIDRCPRCQGIHHRFKCPLTHTDPR